MEELMERFKRYSKSQGKSEKTIQDYLTNIYLFLKYLEEQDQLDISNPEILEIIMDKDIEDYIIYCEDILANVVTTRNLKLTSLKQFYEFLNIRNITNNNPTRTTKLKKPPEVEREFLNVEESLQLIAAVDQLGGNKVNRTRDSLILKIFLYCGLRISEVRNLTVAEFNKDVLMIKGKRGRIRRVGINSEVRKAFNDYMEYRNEKNISNEMLLLTSTGKHMSKYAIFDVVKKYAELSGIKKDIHPHSLRHAYASMTAKTTNMIELQRLLGHEKPTTTQIYYHMDEYRAKEIADENPLLKRVQSV